MVTSRLIILSFLLALLGGPQVLAQPYVEEIRFHGAEFAELVMDDPDAINGAKILRNGSSGYNEVTELNKSNKTQRVVLAGSRFFDSTSLSPNCSYYETSRTQLGKGGLEDEGEIFFLNLSNGSRMKLGMTQTDMLSENESFYFGVNDSVTSGISTPCGTRKVQNTSIDTEDNITSSQPTVNTTVCKNDDFTLLIEDILFNGTLSYAFSMPDATRVTYWVEDVHGFGVKEPVTSDNAGTKRFTPTRKGLGQFTVYANFSKGNCSVTDKRTVVHVPLPQGISCESYHALESPETFTERLLFSFSSRLTDTEVTYWIEDGGGNPVSKERTTSSLGEKQFTPDVDSHPYYVLQARFSSGFCNQSYTRLIRYEGYEETESEENASEQVPTIPEIINTATLGSGESNKGVVDLGLKSTEGFELTLGDRKYLSLNSKGEITFQLPQRNASETMVMRAGDTMTTLQVPATLPQTTTRIHIEGLLVNGSGVRLFLEGSLQDKEGECYGRLHRKLISPRKPLSTFSINHTLRLNETAIRAISSGPSYPVNIYCKYRKKNLTSYRYTSQLINYSLSRAPHLQQEERIGWKNLTHVTKDREVINITPLEYSSEDQLQKWYSPYGVVLGGLVLLGSVFFA